MKKNKNNFLILKTETKVKPVLVTLNIILNISCIYTDTNCKALGGFNLIGALLSLLKYDSLEPTDKLQVVVTLGHAVEKTGMCNLKCHSLFPNSNHIYEDILMGVEKV